VSAQSARQYYLAVIFRLLGRQIEIVEEDDVEPRPALVSPGASADALLSLD
jgi:hypothetical protein